MNRQFTEPTEKTARPKNHVKRCPTSLTARKIQKQTKKTFLVVCSGDAGEMGTLDLPHGNYFEETILNIVKYFEETIYYGALK